MSHKFLAFWLLIIVARGQVPPVFNEVGAVLDVVGDWFVETPGGPQKLMQGYGLKAHSRVYATAEHLGASLTIYLINGRAEHYSCVAPCSDRFVVPDVSESLPTWGTRFFRAFRRIIGAHPQDFVVLIGQTTSPSATYMLAADGGIVYSAPVTGSTSFSFNPFTYTSGSGREVTCEPGQPQAAMIPYTMDDGRLTYRLVSSTSWPISLAMASNVIPLGACTVSSPIDSVAFSQDATGQALVYFPWTATTSFSPYLPALKETVLPVASDGLTDLAPLLRTDLPSMPALSFKLVQSFRPNESNAVSSEIIVRWPSTSVVSMDYRASLSKGLYRVTYLDSSLTLEGPGDAWVLLVPQPDYDKARDSFDHFLAITESWPVNIRLEGLRAILRVYLQFLQQPEDN